MHTWNTADYAKRKKLDEKIWYRIFSCKKRKVDLEEGTKLLYQALLPKVFPSVL